MLLARAEAEARERQLTRLTAAGVALGVEEAGWLVDGGFALDLASDGVGLTLSLTLRLTLRLRLSLTLRLSLSLRLSLTLALTHLRRGATGGPNP